MEKMKLKLISWNVNGIRAAIKKGLWEYVKNEGADIYCFQETKAFPEQVPMTGCPKGYIPYWNPAKKAGYSGVMTLTRIEPKRVILGDRDNDWDDEGRVIITKFDEFTLLNVYFPNGKKDKARLNYKLEFYKYFLKYINRLRDGGEKIIFCGDVNTAHEEIDLARPKENEKVSGFLPIERKWLDELEKNRYKDTFRELHPKEIDYSWWDMKTGARKRNVGWRIDYVFAEEKLAGEIKKAFIRGEIEGSDHAPVGIELELGQRG